MSFHCSLKGKRVKVQHQDGQEEQRYGRAKEKHQYNILTHIYGIQKDGNDNPVCETAKETQMYRTVFWTLWEREGGIIWENGIKTCIISYKKRMASPGSMQDTGSLGVVHWDNPEGWYGKGGGSGVQDGEHVYIRG